MKLIVEFEKPAQATIDDVADFVLDALTSCGGQYHPDDPMFESLRGRIKSIVVHGKEFAVDKD